MRRTFEHTADIGLAVEAPSLEAAHHLQAVQARHLLHQCRRDSKSSNLVPRVCVSRGFSLDHVLGRYRDFSLEIPVSEGGPRGEVKAISVSQDMHCQPENRDWLPEGW